ncbi:SRPBCC family protein [Streptomyces sp. NPDC003691]
MAVRNVHERRIAAAPERIGALLDRLASDDDPLWPVADWPRMRLKGGASTKVESTAPETDPEPAPETDPETDSVTGPESAADSGPEGGPDSRPLTVGAAGGHGPVRYTVVVHEPGRLVRFRFTGPRGFDGHHELAVLPADGGTTLLRHTLLLVPQGVARISWPFFFRPLHDALIEDALDRAERAGTGAVERPARWSPYVRLLRAGARAARPRRPAGSGPARSPAAGGPGA